MHLPYIVYIKTRVVEGVRKKPPNAHARWVGECVDVMLEGRGGALEQRAVSACARALPGGEL